MVEQQSHPIEGARTTIVLLFINKYEKNANAPSLTQEAHFSSGIEVVIGFLLLSSRTILSGVDFTPSSYLMHQLTRHGICFILMGFCGTPL